MKRAVLNVRPVIVTSNVVILFINNSSGIFDSLWTSSWRHVNSMTHILHFRDITYCYIWLLHFFRLGNNTCARVNRNLLVFAHVPNLGYMYVTRQLLRQFRSDPYISKLSMTVGVYKRILIIQCKKKPTTCN